MIHPDYQYDSRVIPVTIEIIRLGICDFVMGSRIRTRRGSWTEVPLYKYLANRCLTFIENVALGQNLGIHSGFRAYRRRTWKTDSLRTELERLRFRHAVSGVGLFQFKLGDIPFRPAISMRRAASISAAA